MREVDQTQETDIRNQGAYYPEIIEDALDKLTDITQQLSERMDRAVTAAPTSTTTLQLPSGQVGYALGWPVSADALGAVPSNVALALSDFASSSSAANGAGMVGFTYALAYAAGTVGKAIKDVMDAATTLAGRATALEATVGNASSSGTSHGACLLTLSGGSLVLKPWRGNGLIINGATCTIPSAGVSLAATGLTAGTLYFVYAFMNGASMELEGVATVHTTDADNGTEIKTGDASRTLVGMVYTKVAATFADTVTQRFVASWFNRRPVRISARFGATRTTTSTSFVEVNSETRCEFVCWAYDVVFGVAGNAWNSSSTGTTSFGPAIDGTTPINSCSVYGTASKSSSCSGVASLSEGHHYGTYAGAASGGTASFEGTAQNFWGLFNI